MATEMGGPGALRTLALQTSGVRPEQEVSLRVGARPGRDPQHPTYPQKPRGSGLVAGRPGEETRAGERGSAWPVRVAMSPSWTRCLAGFGSRLCHNRAPESSLRSGNVVVLGAKSMPLIKMQMLKARLQVINSEPRNS